GARRERGDQHDTAAFMQDRLQLLYQEERRADIDGEQRVEIADGRFFDGCSFGDAGIGDKDVEPIAHNAANLPRELVRAVGSSQIGRDGIGAPAAFTNLRNNVVSLFGTAAVVDKNLG